MVYLHITAKRRPAEQPLPHDDVHGPFATEQEAQGFFRKLKLWYPASMEQATYRLMRYASGTHHESHRYRHSD